MQLGVSDCNRLLLAVLVVNRAGTANAFPSWVSGRANLGIAINSACLRTGLPVLPNERMGDIPPAVIFQALRCVAPAVECKLLWTTTQKLNAAPVSDANEKVQIQGEGFDTGESLATAPVLIAKLNDIWSAGDHLVQFLAFKLHVDGYSSGVDSPDDPRARGGIQLPVLNHLLTITLEIEEVILDSHSLPNSGKKSAARYISLKVNICPPGTAGFPRAQSRQNLNVSSTPSEETAWSSLRID
jgi:hypothetical protein